MESIISADEIAWTAGFFDGEGCVCIHPINKNSTYHLYVTVAQVDIRPLLFLKEKFGGGIYFHNRGKPNNQPSYQWATSGWKALNFLNLIVKHLKVKKEKAEKAIVFQNTFKIKNKKSKRSLKEITFYNEFRNKLAVA